MNILVHDIINLLYQNPTTLVSLLRIIKPQNTPPFNKLSDNKSSYFEIYFLHQQYTPFPWTETRVLIFENRICR